MIFGLNDAYRTAAQGRTTTPIEQDEFTTSYLGTPVYDTLNFLKDDNPDLELSEDFEISDVIFNVTLPKNIIRTRVQGRRGDVNELISLGDYEISIVGVLVSQDQLVQPREAMLILKNIINYEGSLAVSSDYLQALDIDTIVIDQGSIEQQAGYRNQLPFALQCRSEDAIELQIKSNTNAST